MEACSPEERKKREHLPSHLRFIMNEDNYLKIKEYDKLLEKRLDKCQII